MRETKAKLTVGCTVQHQAKRLLRLGPKGVLDRRENRGVASS